MPFRSRSASAGALTLSRDCSQRSRDCDVHTAMDTLQEFLREREQLTAEDIP